MQSTISVDAEHVIHLSLSEGLDANWPFGNSLLEAVFKPFKQKELLEDAIIIYRVQRAPERRVFYIDVGNAPTHKAMEFVNRIKNEIHQRRIPSQTGGGANIMDAGYNPLSMLEDFFFPQTCITLDTKIKLLDGRDLELAKIIEEYNSGKENWTYSINQKTHEMEPGKIVWAGVTRENAEIVRVYLDNGESVTCTPDHRFIMRDGSEVEAQYLKENDSLMPIYTDYGPASSKATSKYARIVDNATGKIRWIYTLICPKKQKNTVIHHVDFNPLNNNPTNLLEMDTLGHKELHKKAGSYSIPLQWKSKEGRDKLLRGIRALYDNASAEFKELLIDRNRKNALSQWARGTEANASSLEALVRSRDTTSRKRKMHYSEELFVELKNTKKRSSKT
jgi:hypothetical protein